MPVDESLRLRQARAEMAVVANNVPRAALLRPPVQFGVGAAFQSAGVPQIGVIAGPEYLVTISPHGEMDKFDDALAARQIAFLADLTTRLDAVPASALRKGDPTLGLPGLPGGGSQQPVERQCGPSLYKAVDGGGHSSLPNTLGESSPGPALPLALTAGVLTAGAVAGRAQRTDEENVGG